MNKIQSLSTDQDRPMQVAEIRFFPIGRRNGKNEKSMKETERKQLARMSQTNRLTVKYRSHKKQIRYKINPQNENHY